MDNMTKDIMEDRILQLSNMEQLETFKFLSLELGCDGNIFEKELIHNSNILVFKGKIDLYIRRNKNLLEYIAVGRK